MMRQNPEGVTDSGSSIYVTFGVNDIEPHSLISPAHTGGYNYDSPPGLQKK